MAQGNNPFYVSPLGGQAGNIAKSLSGIGSIIKENREQAAAQTRAGEMQTAFTSALESGDPMQMMKASISFPEGQKQMESIFGFYKDSQGRTPTKDIVQETYRRVLSNPAEAQRYIQEGAEKVRDAGGDPKMMMSDMQEIAANPEGTLRNIEMAYAGMAPKEYEAFKKLGGTPVDPKERFNQIKELRNEVRKADPDFMKTQDAYGRILASAEDPSPAGDLALIFNYMKVLDPGSTVREGEFATAQGAMASLGRAEGEGELVPNFIKSAVERLTQGTRLLPAQRKDFVGRAGKLFKKAESQRNKRLGPIRKQISNLSIDPDLIFNPPEGAEEVIEEVAEVAPQDVADEGAIISNQAGERMQLTNGQWVKI